jgi:hypothetical protein
MYVAAAAAGAAGAGAGAGAAGARPVLYHCRLHARLLEDSLQRLKVVYVADAQLAYLRDRRKRISNNAWHTIHPLVTSKLPPGCMQVYLYAVMLSISGQYQRQETE